MGIRGNEEHRLWLFDLAHGNLKSDQVVRGFIKFYALQGFTVGNVQDDIVFRTIYEAAPAMETLKAALAEAAGDGRCVA